MTSDIETKKESDDGVVGDGDDSRRPQPDQPHLVPEAVLKRRHDMDEMKARRAAQQLSNPRGNRKIVSGKSAVVRIRKPETFLAAAMSRRNNFRRYDRVRRKGMQKRASDRPVKKAREVVVREGNAADAVEEVTEEREYRANSVGAGLVFVVRIRDGRGAPRQVKSALSLLRLRDVNEGVFVRYDAPMRKKLHLVEPFVAYGVLSKATITDLIHRRGHGNVDGTRVPLSDNVVIEKALGDETGIICAEDLVHEIWSGADGRWGKHFDRAASFLWPFRFAAPRSKYQTKTLGTTGGGRDEYGDRGEAIDELIRLML